MTATPAPPHNPYHILFRLSRQLLPTLTRPTGPAGDTRTRSLYVAVLVPTARAQPAGNTGAHRSDGQHATPNSASRCTKYVRQRTCTGRCAGTFVAPSCLRVSSESVYPAFPSTLAAKNNFCNATNGPFCPSAAVGTMAMVTGVNSSRRFPGATSWTYPPQVFSVYPR